MNKLFFACTAVLMVAAMSCNTNYKKSKTGMEYKIFSGKATGYNKNAPKELKPGNIVKFNFSFSVERKGKGDTTLNDSYAMMPQYMPFDTSEQILRSPIEPLLYSKVGDSVIFRISVDTLIAHQLVQENDVFTKGGVVKGTLSILDAFPNDSLAKIDFDKEVKLFEAKREAKKKTAIIDEKKVIEKYLKDKNINAQQTALGTYYIIEKPGAGTKLDSTKVAVVKYKGYLLDGTVFDTNLDTSKGHSQPLEFPLNGQGGIEGFTDGLRQFSKGATGKIFIPASLGYGDVAQPGLPANSNLVFDVEVIDVKDAPKQSAMPQLTPEQMAELQKQMQQQQGGTQGK